MSIFLLIRLFLCGKDRAEFKQSDHAEEDEHDPGKRGAFAFGDVENVPADQAQGEQE